MTTELLPIKAVADELNVHTVTVKRWIKAGTLEGIRLPSGHWRVSRASVDAVKNPQGA